jgi:hypothetical protein
VVKTLSDGDGDTGGKRLRVADVARVPSALEIELRSDNYRVALAEKFELAFEGIQTFVRPLELEPHQ